MSSQVEHFVIDVPDAVLEDLRDRLARTRFPDQLPGAGWSYGSELETMRRLCGYWRDGFDWRAQEEALNSWPNFATRIDGQRIHFLHLRSPAEGALPLLLIHGWPGSFYEFHKLIGPLVDPEAHGAERSQAFHVVCPSLPGYAFSGPTSERGWHPRRIAMAFAELMRRLGYPRYGVQGGDWGSTIGSQLAVVDEASVAGLHLNLLLACPPRDDLPRSAAFLSDWRRASDFDELSEGERQAARDFAVHRQTDAGYAAIQATKPQTLGYGLNDSPAGLAAWIVDKFRSWSDCDGELERRFSRDELLTNVSIYWVTGTINSANRLYFEAARAGQMGPPAERVRVPTGAAVFPKERARPPRRWVEQSYHLVHWTEMPSGGHFAALEEPDLLAEDLRRFFDPLRVAA